MLQDYFIHNGKKYKSGDIVIINRATMYSTLLKPTKVQFMYYDTYNNEYILNIDGNIEHYNKNRFLKVFRGDKEDTKNLQAQMFLPKDDKKSVFDEMKIDDLFFAWMWYITIMVIAIIFYDRLIIWITSSIIFFNYRKKKLKEAGYK